MPHRIEVATRPGERDPAGDAWRARIREDLGREVGPVRVVDVYTVHAEVSPEELERARTELFTDPVTQVSAIDAPLAPTLGSGYAVEVGFRPGVTDNVGKSAAAGLQDVLGRALAPGETVFKSTQYLFDGTCDAEACADLARALLANDLIEQWRVCAVDALPRDGAPVLELPVVTGRSDDTVRTIDLDVDDDGLMALSREHLLALDLREMQAIRRYYRTACVGGPRQEAGLPAAPTDVELQVLAQTWSEHCKHKIFAAQIEYTDDAGNTRTIDGLFKTYVKGTTDEVAQRVDWLVSVFHDNAGLIVFDEAHLFALKAETHNSPSALDPYGGAMTGIVGVNRDILGAGMGCRCIFNTDVFCFAAPDYAGEIPPRLLHPRRVLRGVHAGVRDGGNQSGIPDINGAIVFHERFLGKPLVFCGTGGLIPREIHGQPSHLKGAQPDDRIVMVGGRIGKDGIHGATFSSEALHEGSPATAVQIGDPITQRKMTDLLLEARDHGLFNAITDNGAGGLSSSVGEMARDAGGAVVHLDRAPLKYAGLAPWEIFLSEAQERMTLAVPPAKLDAFLALARRRDVEATDLGHFAASGHLTCTYNGAVVASLAMDFLHDGLPRMQLRAKWTPPQAPAAHVPRETDYAAALKRVLRAWNVCSKESFVRMYDHEVQGQSVLKPFHGAQDDGPGNAGVIRPVPGSRRGIAVACGICPKYSDLDAYAMMANAIDEAVRNLVATGARPGNLAGLDNFCWPDPVESDKTPDGAYKLAQLVRCCEALYDTCVAYDIPLISGKDSMKNDYRIGDTKISIPPTVLFTAAAIIEDVTQCVSMDVKRPGDIVFLLGETRDELGGSEYLNLLGQTGGTPPQVDPAAARARYTALADAIAAGEVASCHDCSDGGLGVTLAETAFGGGYGLEVELSALRGLTNEAALFSESASRLVATVHPEHAHTFAARFSDGHCYRIGSVIAAPQLNITLPDGATFQAPLDELKAAWQEPLAI